MRRVAAEVAARRFNGEIVSELTGLSGVQLGTFICDFKNHIGKELFPCWVLATSRDDIRTSIREFALTINNLHNNTGV
jgi:hypothetical protein